MCPLLDRKCQPAANSTGAALFPATKAGFHAIHGSLLSNRFVIKNRCPVMQDLVAQSQHLSRPGVDRQTVLNDIAPTSAVADLTEIVFQRKMRRKIQLSRIVKNQHRRLSLSNPADNSLTMRCQNGLVRHLIAIHQPIKPAQVLGIVQLLRQRASRSSPHRIRRCDQPASLLASPRSAFANSSRRNSRFLSHPGPSVNTCTGTHSVTSKYSWTIKSTQALLASPARKRASNSFTIDSV